MVSDQVFCWSDRTLFQVGAIITSQLVLYDLVKQLLGMSATGASYR
jgi:hypothetical protein